jgi:hypothetical protein
MTPGTLVGGRFLIDRVVGRGGMGAVYRALDQTTSQPVALKVAVVSSPDVGERFMREAQVLAGLDHPAIVRHVAHDVDAALGAWLAMEWLEGENLATTLGRGPLPLAETLTVAQRAAEALSAVHALGYVHRDVTPSNVFLPDREPARLKLLDFGIAHALAGGGPTRTGAMIGTPAYVAPEQARGDKRIDARVDVYALGGLVFHSLAGRPVFTGEQALAVLAKVLFAPAESLLDAVPSAPAWLVALVDACLDKDRDARPRDAAAVLAALDARTVPTRRPARPAPSISGERQVTSVVLAPATSGDPAREGTLSTSDVDRLREALAPVAGEEELSFDALRDGSLVAIAVGPGEATDRAGRAARCALALRALLPGRPIAVATGRGTASPRGLGEVLERAAGLVARAGGDVLVDATSAALLQARFALSPVAGPGEGAAHLLGDRVDDDRRLLLGQRTPCVGRERDLDALAAHVAECSADGGARMVVVTAGPGVGKTRLRLELLARVGRPAWLARGDAWRSHVPFGVVAGLLRSAVGSAERDPPDVAAAALHRRLARVLSGDALERAAVRLGGILSLGDVAAEDPKIVGEQVRRSWEEWLSAETADATVLIAVDDLHWADAPSVALLAQAVRALDRQRLVVLGFSRPEARATFPSLFAARGVHEHRLSELSPRAGEALVAHALGPGVGPAVAASIAQRSTGNAFYLEELIRNFAEGRGDEMPGSVAAMVDRRLARLPDDARAVLRVASVFGERFHAGAVAAVLGHEVTYNLEGLCAEEVIVRLRDSRFAGETAYAFRHALLRDGAYDTMLADDRRAAHAQAARWLRAAGDEDAAAIGRHHETAGEDAAAAECFVTAARQAYARNDFAGALALLARAEKLGAAGLVLGKLQAARGKLHGALGAWSESAAALAAALPLLEEAPADLRADALVDAAYASFWSQDVDRIVPHAMAAVELSTLAGRDDLTTDAEALVSLGHAATDGMGALALEWLGRARARAAGKNSKALAQAAQILYHSGRLDEAVAFTGGLVGSARAAQDTATLVLCLSNHGLALAGRGRYAEAERALDEAQELGRSAGATALLARATSMAAGWRLELDDLDGAEATAERAAELAGVASFVFPLNSARIDQLFVAARRGDLVRAERLAAWIADSIRAEARGSHFWLWTQRSAVALAELELAKGNLELAVERAAGAFTQARRYVRPKYQALAYHALARARDALGQREAARADARRAWETAYALGDPAVRLRTARTLAALTGETVEDVALAEAEIQIGLHG